MGFLPLLLLGLGIAAASWFAWVSIQSLLQARMLYRLARLPSQAPDPLGRAAFYGRVAVTRRLELGFGELLWCRTEEQVYRRRGKNSGWKTESTKEEVAGFTIDAHGGPVSFEGLPTEVQGAKGRTDVHHRSGWFGLGHGSGDRRTVYTYLPVIGYASLVGRLKVPGVVERDNKLGLLLSAHEPGKAANIELFKGLAGLVAVTALIFTGLHLYLQHRR